MISNTEFSAYAGASPVGYPLESAGSPARILELGSGCGMGTRELVDRFPKATIVCLEPDDAARNALLWHLRHESAGHSVLPLTVQEAAHLIGTFDLIVAHHVICQIRVADRAAFWIAVRGLLANDGIVLTDSHFGRTKTGSDPRRLGSATGQDGEYRVHRWFSAEAQGPVAVVTNEYEFVDARGTVIYRSVQRTEVDVVDVATERRLVSRNGLVIEDLDDRWLRLTATQPAP